MFRLACIGAGYWGKNLVRNFYELGVLSMVCDENNGVLSDLSLKYPEVQATSKLSDVFNDDSISAVAISTPAETHYDLIKRALRAGKHVYVEKPLCMNLKEGEEVSAIAKKCGLTLMVGHLLWYHPAVLKVKEILDDSLLGSIRHIYSNRLNTGLLRKEENVLWSFAPHDISVILGLVGDSPVEVSVKENSWLHDGVSDLALVWMSFANNVTAHINVSWLNPFKEQKLVVICESGMMVFDDTKSWSEKLAIYRHEIDFDSENLKFSVSKKVAPDYVILEEVEPLQEECRHFMDAVVNGMPVRTSAEEGVTVLRVLSEL